MVIPNPNNPVVILHFAILYPAIVPIEDTVLFELGYSINQAVITFTVININHV